MHIAYFTLNDFFIRLYWASRNRPKSYKKEWRSRWRERSNNEKKFNKIIISGVNTKSLGKNDTQRYIFFRHTKRCIKFRYRIDNEKETTTRESGKRENQIKSVRLERERDRKRAWEICIFVFCIYKYTDLFGWFVQFASSKYFLVLRIFFPYLWCITA